MANNQKKMTRQCFPCCLLGEVDKLTPTSLDPSNQVGISLANQPNHNRQHVADREAQAKRRFSSHLLNSKYPYIQQCKYDYSKLLVQICCVGSHYGPHTPGYAIEPQAVSERPDRKACHCETEMGNGVQRLPGLH